MSEKRTTGLEDVPTLKELGYNVEYSVNRGIMVPKGTPPEVIAKLNDACAKATKEPEYAKAMLLQGTEVRYMDPERLYRISEEDRRARPRTSPRTSGC